MNIMNVGKHVPSNSKMATLLEATKNFYLSPWCAEEASAFGAQRDGIFLGTGEKPWIKALKKQP